MSDYSFTGEEFSDLLNETDLMIETDLSGDNIDLEGDSVSSFNNTGHVSNHDSSLSKVTVKPRKKHRFLIFMIVYSLLILTAGGFGLEYLHDTLDDYESSLPKHVLSAYTEQLHSGNVPDALFTTLSKIDTNVQTIEDSMAFMKEKLRSAVLYKAVNESTETREVYSIRNGDDVIGKAVMTQTGKSEHGFSLWEITDTELNFDCYLNRAEITVPSEFRVEMNGKAIPRDHITDSRVRYSALASFYSAYPELPTMVTYTTGDVLGEISFSVYNSGNKLLSEDELNETLYLNSMYPAGNRNELTEYIGEFVERYAEYTSNAGGYTSMLYSRLKELVMPESDLHNRIRMAFDAMNYIDCRECTVSDENLLIAIEPVPGLYFADVEYTTTVIGGHHEEKTDSSELGLMISRDSRGDLRAESMATY